MPTTVLYLVRHAQIAENLPRGRGDLRYGAFPDAPLDELGRRQAAALRQKLAPIAWAGAYSSPYRRAGETARIILDGLANRPPDLTLVTDARWQERDYGEFDGLLASEIARVRPPGAELFYASEDGHPGGAESLREVQARARAAFDEVAERHEGETVLVVSHKTTLRVLVCDLLGLPLTMYKRIGQDNAARNVVTIGPALLSADGPDVRVELINDTCHLADLASAGQPQAGMESLPRG